MSEELDNRLRRDLATLDNIEVADRQHLRAAGARLATRRAARRRTAMLTTCFVLVVAGGGAIWWATTRPIEPAAANQTLATPPGSLGTVSGSTNDATTAPPNVDPTIPTTNYVVQPEDDPHLSGSWRPIPANPEAIGNQFAAVWTGNEALVLSGVDGAGGIEQIHLAAYDPSSHGWRTLAPPLLDGMIAPITVWSGDELLVIAGGLEIGPVQTQVDRSQAYDPTSDSWRPIATPLMTMWSGNAHVWTGSQLLVLPDDSTVPISYSPATDTWGGGAPMPVAARSEAASVWTGTEWIVWGGSDGSTHFDDGAAYDPATDTWRTIAESPLSGRKVHAVWTGSEVLIDAGWTGDATPMALADGATYNPVSDAWRPIAPGPAHPGFEPLFTGRYLLQFAKGFVEVYDLDTNVWVDTCCATGGSSGSAVWTGSEALVFSGFEPGGAAFTPPPA